MLRVGPPLASSYFLDPSTSTNPTLPEGHSEQWKQWDADPHSAAGSPPCPISDWNDPTETGAVAIALEGRGGFRVSDMTGCLRWRRCKVTSCIVLCSFQSLYRCGPAGLAKLLGTLVLETLSVHQTRSVDDACMLGLDTSEPGPPQSSMLYDN